MYGDMQECAILYSELKDAAAGGHSNNLLILPLSRYLL